MNPSERLKKAREHLGLTQKQLAEKLGFPWHKIKNIETEKHKLTSEIAQNIEQFYSISGWWLLTGKGEMLLSKTDTPEEYKQLEDTLIEKLTAQVIKEELDNYVSEEEAQIIKKFRKLPDNLKKAHQLELDRDLLDEQSKALRKKRVNTPIDSPTDTNAIA